MIKDEQRIVTKSSEIGRIAEKIAKNKKVKAVYLFGSYAEGKPNKLSDVDLCIITQNKYELVDYPVSDNLDGKFLS